MEYITQIIYVVVGLLISNMTLTPTLVTLFFSIPFTKELMKRNVINKGEQVLKKFNFSIVVWMVSLIGVSVLLFFVANRNSFFFFAFGILASVLIKLSNFGRSERNIRNYVNTYRPLISMKRNNEYKDSISYSINEYMKGL